MMESEEADVQKVDGKEIIAQEVERCERCGCETTGLISSYDFTTSSFKSKLPSSGRGNNQPTTLPTQHFAIKLTLITCLVAVGCDALKANQLNSINK